jgi:hypothetical protein
MSTSDSIEAIRIDARVVDGDDGRRMTLASERLEASGEVVVTPVVDDARAPAKMVA